MLCWFFACRWLHLCNVEHSSAVRAPVGLYQCLRCKTVSVGAVK